MSKEVKITQIRSQIGWPKKIRAILKNLRLARIGRSAKHTMNGAIAGQVRVVQHLVRVEEI